MPLWSRLRALLGLGPAAPAEAEGAGPPEDARAGEPVSAEPGRAAPGRAAADPDDQEADGEAAPEPLPGTLDDWDSSSQTGTITLTDGAVVRFGIEACDRFRPLIGLRVDVLGTGVPPEGAAFEEGNGLWATTVRLRPGSEAEYAARLRVYQVERAVRGEDGVVPGEPPWARNKAGKKPAGPGRPPDAFFALTVILERELPLSPTALSGLFDSPLWRQPLVRLIPLLRKGKPEAGFSAEIVCGAMRGFLLYRPQPYLCGDGTERGRGHVGLFVGGPHGPRALAELPAQVAAGPPPLSDSGEVRLISDLVRSLLSRDSESSGLVVNRAGKAWKPRDIALSQLGEDDSRAPFLLWIDWAVAERDGHRVMRSLGMESLGLPDVAVRVTADDQLDAARDAVWWVCQLLCDGKLAHPPEHAPGPGSPPVPVPRRIRLLPGSRIVAEEPAEPLSYRVLRWDREWLELEAPAAAVRTSSAS